MREITIKLYSFDELSDTAKERAFAKWQEWELEFPWNAEYRATLEAFQEAFDVGVYQWYVDENTFNYAFAHDQLEPQGDWLRFEKWLWNNYSHQIRRGKYYGKNVFRNGKWEHVHRHSNATREYTCCFTGFAADMTITKPARNCFEYTEAFTTYDQFIESCLDEFFEEWRNDMCYHASVEYFAETCEANGYEFTENGEFWG